MSQLEEIRARHRRVSYGTHSYCTVEGGPKFWPCDVAILISELERAEKVIAAQQEHIDKFTDWGYAEEKP